MTDESVIDVERTNLVIRLRMQGWSLATTAKVFNISRLRVRQIESNYFRTFREESL